MIEPRLPALDVDEAGIVLAQLRTLMQDGEWHNLLELYPAVQSLHPSVAVHALGKSERFGGITRDIVSGRYRVLARAIEFLGCAERGRGPDREFRLPE
ncbi:MAG: hypothetical protein IT305_21580 [Chloroflexi bacterium]|nr:hypothetical protein [Chloroflexota bacterium]